MGRLRGVKRRKERSQKRKISDGKKKVEVEN